MSLYQPLGLLALLVLPAGVALWWWVRRRPVRFAVRFTNVEAAEGVADRGRHWRRVLPAALFVAALISASVAVARPYRRVLVAFERETVVLVVDVSTSMAATDIRPSRIGAAQQAAGGFVAGLPGRVRVGVIAFSDEPEVVASPTSDRRLVRAAIATLTPGGATAIGDALAAALRLGERAVGARSGSASAARPRTGLRGVSIVLLSDGRNDSGRLRPLQAARLARRAGVPVYTIALGSPQGMRVATEAGSYFIDPPDAAALRAIAAATGGRFATAASAAALRGAYTRLGRELGWRRGHEEISSLFAAAAAALLVAAGVLSTIWAPRLP